MTRPSLITGLLALLLLGAAVMVFLALVATRPGATTEAARERTWVVETTTVEPATHRPTLRLYGRVESPNDTVLSASMEADVLEVAVSEGELVSAGQLLVRLDPRDLELNLTQRQSEVAELEAMLASEQTRHAADQRALEQEQTLLGLSRQALQRATTLKKRNLGSDSVLDEARQGLARQQLALNAMRKTIDDYPSRRAQLQAKLARARAALGRTHLELERTNIVAPFAGRIAEVMTSPGARARDGEQLLQMYDTQAIEIRAQVPETQVWALQRGLQQAGHLNASATLDGETLKLRLKRLAGRVEPGRGGVEGLFQLQPGTRAPRLGRFVDLRLELPPEPETVALPGSAIYGTHRIYRIDEQRLQPLTIERVGSLTRDGIDRFLVRSAELRRGDRVLTTQLANAIDGLRVELAEP